MGVVVRCVGALVYDDDRWLLLVQRGREPHAGSWSLPGGRIEPGESGAQAVIREVSEETGLLVHPDRVVGRVRRAGPAGVVYAIEDWACTVTGGVLHAGDDAADARFVSASALRELELSPGLLDALTRWVALPS